MKPICLTLAAALSVLSAAGAQARPFVPAMSCGQAAGLVAASGAAVLSTSQTTYDRFVHDRRFCSYGEYLDPAYVQTRDASACFIGYTCTSRDPYIRFGRSGGF